METDTAKNCQEKCKNRQDCQWYSYNKEIEVCAQFETCTAMNDQTDYISSQSQCSDSHYHLDSHELDSHNEFDDPKLDHHELDNPYKCNQTGMCLVSHYTCRKVSSRSKSLLVACLVLKHPKKV